jgi:ribosomal protein L32E
MKTTFFLAAFLFALAFNQVFSHPGVGIVQDSKGTVFYTDTERVWKISVDGKKSIAVPDVHTHELYIDDHDNLFGEHLWYNGERANTWGHYVWRLSPDGRLEKVIPNTEGFLVNYSFVRDHFGRMYWADRSSACQKLARKNVDSSVTQLGDQCMNNIRWMKATASGDVYLVDFQDLKKIDTQGKIKTIASQIADKKMTISNISNQNSVFGVWDDAQGNIYTAIASARVVKKFSLQGKEEIVLKIPLLWSPTGGLVAANGDLWVLECSVTNNVRVERVDKNGKRQVY